MGEAGSGGEDGPRGRLNGEEEARMVEGGPAEAVNLEAGRVQGSFEKLREMLDRLRQSNGIQTQSNATPAKVEERPRSMPETVQPAPSGEAVARAALMGRFDLLTLQMRGEAGARPTEGTRLMDLTMSLLPTWRRRRIEHVCIPPLP